MLRWINDIGIQRRLLFLAILPVVIITLILGFYITTSRIADIHEALNARGEALAKHLASSAEFGMFVDNRILLESLANKWLAEPDVTKIVIRDDEKNIIVEVDNDEKVSEVDKNDILVFAQEVLESGIDVSDEIGLGFGSQSTSQAKTSVVGYVRVELSTATTKEQERLILINAALIMLSGVLLSAIFALRIGGSVANPIIHMTRAMKQLRNGVFDVSISENHGGELGTLSSGFNEMAKTLRESQLGMQSEVETATTELREMVSELEVKNRELDKARKEAISAGQAKLDFLAKMSHEIRTPVNAVIGFTKLMEQTEDEEERKEYARTTQQAGKQLLNIINDILNFSKIEYDTLALEEIPFSLRDLLEDVVLMHGPSAYEKGVELVFDIHSSVELDVFGDSTRLSQILSNLISNAIKFTEAGTVSLTLEKVDSDDGVAYKFTVKDTGVGISEGEKEKLFKAFSQVDSSITRRYGGTGLGLAIAKRLVDLMNGTIGVESEKNRGSEFWFILPLQRQSGTAKDLWGGLLQEKKVLIIEENPITRRALRNTFFRCGAMVFAQSQLEKGESLLASGQEFDLVIIGISYIEAKKEVIVSAMARVRQAYSGVVLLLLGRDDYIVSAELREDTLLRILPKPTRTAVMVRTLLPLLGSEARASDEIASRGETEQLFEQSYAGKRILVAEDNNFNKLLITKLLSQFGIETIEASNGREAIEKYLQSNVDMILMDIHMPEMDGLEAAKQIRNVAGQDVSVPIIALTADVFIKDRKNLSVAGLDDYLLKPISESKLEQILFKWLGQAGEIIEDNTEYREKTPTADDVTDVPDELRQRLNDELGVCIRSVKQRIDVQDLKGAFEEAHKLLGMIGYFKLDALMRDARELDGALKQEDLTRAQLAYKSLSAELYKVLENQE